MRWKEPTLGEIEHGGVIQTDPFGSQFHQSDCDSESLRVIMVGVVGVVGVRP